MGLFKRLWAVVAVGGIAAAAYFAGSQQPPKQVPAPVAATPGPATHGLVVPTVTPKASYDDIAVLNPTKVLLGEEKIPDDLLVTPPPPAEGLVIPTLQGK